MIQPYENYFDEATGMYLYEGTHYDTPKSMICNGMLEIDDFHDSAQLILDTLVHLRDRPKTNKYHDELVNEVFGGIQGAAYIVLSILDNKGFLDYGVSLRGSWVEPSGDILINDLTRLLR